MATTVARVDKACPVCGRVFAVRITELDERGTFCSRACKHAYRKHPPTPRTCPVCGATYLAEDREVARGKQTTCSRACSYELRARAHRGTKRPRTTAEHQRLRNNAKSLRRYYLFREQIAARAAVYRTVNPERTAARKRLYAATHREQAAAIAGRRRARKNACAINDLTAADWRAILDDWGHRCAYCNATDVKLTKDHVVALARGGNHTRSNIVPACKSCNCRKWCHPAAHLNTSRASTQESGKIHT
jgi:hypothetical protein